MSAFVLPALLGFGMIVVAPCYAAGSSQASDGGPPITGSMYNGNNTQPPQFISQDRTQYDELKTDKPDAAVDNKAGQSNLPREGGGG